MKLPALFESSEQGGADQLFGLAEAGHGRLRHDDGGSLGVEDLRFCSAGKKPGHKAFTRTPRGASSRATFCVRFTTAAFEAL